MEGRSPCSKIRLNQFCFPSGWGGGGGGGRGRVSFFSRRPRSAGVPYKWPLYKATVKSTTTTTAPVEEPLIIINSLSFPYTHFDRYGKHRGAPAIREPCAEGAMAPTIARGNHFILLLYDRFVCLFVCLFVCFILFNHGIKCPRSAKKAVFQRGREYNHNNQNENNNTKISNTNKTLYTLYNDYTHEITNTQNL